MVLEAKRTRERESDVEGPIEQLGATVRRHRTIEYL